MVPIGLKVLRMVGLDVHKYGNDLRMQTQDICLNTTGDGVAFGDRRGLRDLQVEIDLEPIAQATGPESMESLGARGGQDVLTQITQDVGGRSGIQEVFATPFE